MPLAGSFPEISVRSRQQTYKESPAAFEINDKVSTRSKRGEGIWEYLIPFMAVTVISVIVRADNKAQAIFSESSRCGSLHP